MAASISTDIEVAEFAGQLFFRLWRASHTRTAEALDSVGLSPALFALLNVLGAREGAIQQHLSADMGIDPSAMVKLINELENTGWPSADGVQAIAAPGRSQSRRRVGAPLSGPDDSSGRSKTRCSAGSTTPIGVSC